MTDVYLNARRYRLNVGVVVFNRDGRVWLGRRADIKGDRIWQFPQGGVDRNEDLLDAARRELWEETGIRTASLIARAPGWITYDFPAGFTGSKAMKGFSGQTQAWFAFRFEGEDSEIDLAAHQPIEFDAWRWADLSEAADLVVGFKREAYLKVIDVFSPIVLGLPMAEPQKGVLLMIHGVGGSGANWDPMKRAFEDRGWAVEAPTLKASLRVNQSPPPELADVGLADYVDEACGWARDIEHRTGAAPVLIGHSMGGLIVQKLLEKGIGRAGVLIAPAPPADVGAKASASVAITFANILLATNLRSTPKKIWRTGFTWGVLNCVPKSRHSALYAAAVYDPGKVFDALKSPKTDPGRTAFIDETAIKVPILTLAGAKDRATPLAWVAATAEKYAKIGGDYRQYPDHAHWMIDEPGSDAVVADIDAWLEAKLV